MYVADRGEAVVTIDGRGSTGMHAKRPPPFPYIHIYDIYNIIIIIIYGIYIYI